MKALFTILDKRVGEAFVLIRYSGYDFDLHIASFLNYVDIKKGSQLEHSIGFESNLQLIED